MILEVRAWNKEKGIMVYDNEDGSDAYFDGICCSDIYMVNSTLKKYSTYEWLPFTGRLDDSRESKKIYSADFVKRMYKRDDREDFIGEVKFYNGRWVLVDSERKCIDLYEGAVFEDYIIGNSYEGESSIPDLLKSNSFTEDKSVCKIIVDSKEFIVPNDIIKSIIDYVLSEKDYYKINIKVEDNYLFEGNDKLSSESLLKLFIKGSFIIITDIRDNCKSYSLSLALLLDGIELYINLNPKKFDMSNWNVDDYSCCFQFSLFSKLKYGN